ncbi:hypothetical protein CO044_03080 [Candidatus Peregrinibacteria bacterium CG_4_9_14_0_2_um_filter_38_9]|nr:MAG: hypothetical protein CO044_03080 [Candidatus Peregrinibacteria bacterium CG_4_9_14_0_2_um_filter_38_9]
MDVDAFIKFIETNDLLTGKFEFCRNEDLMDLDFVNKRFVDFELRGGDYASGSFINCTFDRVLFKDLTLVGVSFGNCDFIDCKLSNVESDFSLSNCRIGHFTTTQESF